MSALDMLFEPRVSISLPITTPTSLPFSISVQSPSALPLVRRPLALLPVKEHRRVAHIGFFDVPWNVCLHTSHWIDWAAFRSALSCCRLCDFWTLDSQRWS